MCFIISTLVLSLLPLCALIILATTQKAKSNHAVMWIGHIKGLEVHFFAFAKLHARGYHCSLHSTSYTRGFNKWAKSTPLYFVSASYNISCCEVSWQLEDVERSSEGDVVFRGCNGHKRNLQYYFGPCYPFNNA